MNWLVTLIPIIVQNGPAFAKAVSALISWFESLSEKDRQAIKDQLAAAAKVAEANVGDFDQHTLATIASAQAQIDALPDHPVVQTVSGVLQAVRAEILTRASAPLAAK